MGRQQTLGKFFEMPKGVKTAPLQQSNLREMWGKKTVTTSAPLRAESTEKDTHDPMVVDLKPLRPNMKRKESPEAAEGTKAPSKKKRRVVDSGDEDTRATKSSSPTPPSPPAKTTSGISGKGKRKAIAEVESEDEAKSVVSEAPEDDSGEEELSDNEDTAAAELALHNKFDVDINGGWKVGEPVPYAALAHTFALIEGTTKRIEKTSYLTSLLLKVIQRTQKPSSDASVKGKGKANSDGSGPSLLHTVYLCINRLCPDYVGVELGIGESLLIKAIGESTGRSLANIKTDLKKEGDLGLVAMNSKASQRTLFKPKPLTVPTVFSQLKDIATTTGHSSQSKKTGIITKLLAACQSSDGKDGSSSEAKYIIRSLEGKLRIGLAERTVLVSLAHAIVLDEKERSGKKWNKETLSAKLEEGALTLKQVYSELPSYDLVIPALLEVGISGLKERCKLTPGVPLKPMLAKPTKAIGEVLDRFEGKKFTCEYKYDGERAQVHVLENGTVRVFSRNSEDMSKKYPDLVEQLPRCFKSTAKSFVLDAEAVAIDKTTGKLMPFQELSKRKRKDVKIEDIQVRVCLFAFDLLFLNGESLLYMSLADRRALLREHFQAVPGEFEFAISSDGETTEEIQAFLEDSVKDGCEGLMVKMLDSEESYYTPSRRSINWLKLKKDYLSGVGDSLDLVVVGGYYGKGKRTNVYGAFLLACYDADSEEYQTICKIGTGFSEEMLASHHQTLKNLEMSQPRGDYKIGGAKPDVWFQPEVVWEVLTADLSLSPIYTAAQGLVDERGISLRFPRFIRIRDDKGTDDATGPEQIAEMYQLQALAQTQSGKKKKGGGGEDDGFW